MTVGELLDRLTPLDRSLPVWVDDSEYGEDEPTVIVYRKARRKNRFGAEHFVPCVNPDDVPVKVVIQG